MDGCLIIATLAVADNVAAAVSGFKAATDPSTTSGTSELTTAPVAGKMDLVRGASTTNGSDLALYVCHGKQIAAGATGAFSTNSTGITARHAMAAIAVKAV